MRTVLAGLLLALPVLASAPASAEGALVVRDLRVGAGYRSITANISTTGLPDGTALDPATVVARAGDRVLPTTAAVTSRGTTSSVPRVVVVLDTSGSMQGRPMTEAKQAVSAFVADAPAAVRIGLLQFSSSPRLLVPPTTDRSRLLGAVAGVEAQGETALYDAVLEGLRALGSGGDRRLVVLSDGADTRSTATLERALQSTATSGAVLHAIGFNTDEAVDGVLRRLTGKGRGKVHQASNAAQLTAALGTTTRTHARSLDVRVLVPDDLRGTQDLTFSVVTARGRLAQTAAVPLGAAAQPATGSGWWGSREALLTGCAALAVALLLATLSLVGGGRRRQQRTVQALLARYTTSTAPAGSDDLRTASPVVRTALDLAGKVAARREGQDRVALQLDRAAVAMTPAEWLLLRAGLGVASLLLLVLLGAGPVVALLLAVAAGTAAPALVLRVRSGRRRRAFEDRLPDALQMVSGSLSAGYSLAQSLDGLVREGSEPMAGEIGRALAESRLGVPVEATLDGVADRMDSRDFRWVVMAIRVQREVGGNLAGVLTTVAGTMRERAVLRRHVRGLSAEGRLSAYILVGLPVFLTLYMLTLRRSYIEPLYTTPLGIALVVAALLLLSIGSFWMSRMVKVEV